jgi:hypothetical protein
MRRWQQTEWTDADTARLRVLWDDGLTTAAIARDLGRSKSSIVGKAHRLDLDPRPSPIFRDGERQPLKPRVDRPHRSVSTLPALKSVPMPVVIVAPIMAADGCRFLSMDSRPWIYCDAPCLWGSAWCVEHRKRVYTRVAA